MVREHSQCELNGQPDWLRAQDTGWMIGWCDKTVEQYDVYIFKQADCRFTSCRVEKHTLFPHTNQEWWSTRPSLTHVLIWLSVGWWWRQTRTNDQPTGLLTTVLQLYNWSNGSTLTLIHLNSNKAQTTVCSVHNLETCLSFNFKGLTQRNMKFPTCHHRLDVNRQQSGNFQRGKV